MDSAYMDEVDETSNKESELSTEQSANGKDLAIQEGQTHENTSAICND